MDPILPDELGTAEGTQDERIGSAIKGIMQKDRLALFTDKAFYTVIVFQSAEQVAAFTKATGWKAAAGEYWIDGIKLAAEMGIELPKVNEETLAEAYRARPNRSLEPAIARGLKFFDLKEKGGE